MKKTKKLFIILTICILLVVATGIYVWNSPKLLSAFGFTKPVPVFIFDQSKAPGWWAGDNYNSQAGVDDTYEGDVPPDKLPVAGFNIFKGKKGQNETDCFVMVSYYDYKEDVARLKEEKERSTPTSMPTVKVGEKEAAINVLGSSRAFSLTHFEVTGPESKDLMKGMNYGWIETDEGYISVAGVCPTAAQLDDTIEVMKAISLVKGT